MSIRVILAIVAVVCGALVLLAVGDLEAVVGVGIICAGLAVIVNA